MELPWVETDAIQKSRKVMLDMLNYLSEINSPLHHFVCNNSRVNEMTSINPYPKIKTYVLSLNEYPRTYDYLGEQPIAVTT